MAIAKGFADVLDEKLDKLVTETRFNAATSKMDAWFEHIDDRFEQVDQRFQRVDERFERLERRVERLETLIPEVRLHTWMLALLIAALVIPKLQVWFA